MVAYTVAEIDRRIDAMRRITQDPRRPLEQRLLIRHALRWYLHRRDRWTR